MEHTFPLEHGKMTCWEHGDRVNLHMEIRNDKQGLYKGWIQGEKGRLELGTLTPEGNNTLRLGRSMPRDSLHRAGCWPITGCGVTMVHAFGSRTLPKGWRREEEPARLFPDDPIMREAAERLETCLLCESKEGFSIAVPFQPGKSFALIPVFCFAKIRTMGGRLYAVFSFDPACRPRA